MQYTIEKPYKMVTKNATFQKKFQLLLGFYGHFWKISVSEKWLWQAWNGDHAHHKNYTVASPTYARYRWNEGRKKKF